MKSPETEDDLNFLQSLDQRLHYIASDRFTPNMFRAARQVTHNKYNQEEKLTATELDHILNVMNKEHFALYPINTNFGLSAGFAVCQITLEGMLTLAEPILQFTVKQLPSEVNWLRMSECYMSERNKELLKIAGLDEPQHSQEYYSY